MNHKCVYKADVEGWEDWHGKPQTKYNEQIMVGERILRNLSNMTSSSKYKIKEQEEQSKISGHLLTEKIRTLMLEKDKHVERLFQSEINMEEMRK